MDSDGLARPGESVPITRTRPPPPGRPPSPRDARIYAVIRAIPAGRVMTYGAVAAAAGLPGRARLVGRLLRTLSEGSRVPWQRVINAAGRVSARNGHGAFEQRLRLEMEGVQFLPGGRIDLAAFGWSPSKRRGPTSARRAP